MGVKSFKELWEKARGEYDGLVLCMHTEYQKSEESENQFHAIFSSDNEDRHGDIVRQEFDLRAFKKNPVFLDSHNYGSIEHIIGRVKRVAVKDGKLQGDIEFFLDNPKGQLAKLAVEKGFLGTTSIGFIPREFSDKGEILKSELLEVSAVSVPANADALIEKALERSGEAPAKEEELAEEDDPQPSQPETKKKTREQIVIEMAERRKKHLKFLAENIQELVEKKRFDKKREIYKTLRNLLKE